MEEITVKFERLGMMAEMSLSFSVKFYTKNKLQTNKNKLQTGSFIEEIERFRPNIK